MDLRSSWPEVQAKQKGNIRSQIRGRIQSTGMDPAMAEPPDNWGSIDKHCLHYVPEELIGQHEKSFNHLSSFVAAAEPSIRFPAVLHMSGSAIASSSQPIPCCDSNSNSNDITNMTSVKNMGSVNGSMIFDRAMSFGG